jgi:hypothetical protein
MTTTTTLSRSLTRTFALAALAALASAAPAAAQTFSDQTIHEARLFFQANAASSSKKDCITTVNHAIREVFYKGRQAPRLGSRMDLTYAALQRAGRATAPRTIDFVDANGRPTSGATPPQRLRTSVFDAVVSMCRGAPGWYVVGLSIMDGYHSVTLVVDTRRPGNPYINYADQWFGGGWKAYARGDGLDAQLEEFTRGWYQKFLTKRGVPPRTRITLWRLLPPGAASRPARGIAGALGG